MTYSVTCEIHFCAGHRLAAGYRGKCMHLHGHNYRAEIDVESERLTGTGMVLDFADVKKTIGEWVDAHWDHAMILWEKDDMARAAMAVLERAAEQTLATGGLWGEKPRVFWLPENPTAEHMAAFLLARTQSIVQLIDHHMRVRRVRLWETPNCSAEVRP